MRNNYFCLVASYLLVSYSLSNISAQSIEWFREFEEGTIGGQIQEVDDSLLLITLNNTRDKKPSAHLFNKSGMQIDSLYLPFQRNYTKIIRLFKTKKDELIFIDYFGEIIKSTTKLEKTAISKIPLKISAIDNAFITTSKLFIVAFNYVNSSKNYYRCILDHDLNILQIDSFINSKGNDIIHVFENGDYVKYEQIDSTINLYFTDSHDQLISSVHINENMMYPKVTEMRNGDIILQAYTKKTNIANKEYTTVVRLDRLGNIKWSKLMEPKSNSLRNRNFFMTNSIVEDSNEDIYILGSDGYVVFGPISNAVIIKLNKDGEKIWSYSKYYCEGNSFDDVLIDRNKEMYLLGTICLSDIPIEIGILLKFKPVIIQNKDYEVESIQIQPNPSSEYITMKIPNDRVIKRIKIYDMHGIEKTGFIKIDGDKVNIGQLAAGIYYGRVWTTDEEEMSLRFIKQ